MRYACAVAGVCFTLGGTLDGKSMTIEEVVAIARYGAKVELTPAARTRSKDATS
jgi:hypothetical protein